MIQEIDLSTKKLVGPDGDSYAQAVADAPFEAVEPDLSFLVKNYLNTGSVYFDVGANIGATVVPVAKRLRDGLVYGFEPSRAYQYLEENVKNNSLNNVKLFNIALGEKEGEVSFKTRDCLAHSHRLSSENYRTEVNIDKVKITRLDDIVKKENLNKIDLVKIDVEGYERNVLEGCDYLIEKFNPIFYLEFNSWCLVAFLNESPRKFLKFLSDKFTNVYCARNHTLTLLDTEAKLMDFLHSNLVYNGGLDNLVCLNGDIELRRPGIQTLDQKKTWFSGALSTVDQVCRSLLSKKKEVVQNP